MSRRRLLVEADGGSRGNPGPAGFGAVVRDADTGEVLDEVAAAIGTATNNVAEYSGLLAGLRAACAIDPDAEVEVRMDSKLVVEQMSGRWKIKHDDMRRLALQARAVLPADRVSYTWVPRELNAHADRLANAAMDAAARGERWARESRHGDPVPGARGDDAVPSGGQRSRGADAATYAAAPRRSGGEAMSYAGDITPGQAWDLLARDPDAVLVDVRTAAEWTWVGVPDLSDLGKRLLTVEWNRWPEGTRNEEFVDELRAAGVSPGQPIAFLCRSGQRSAAAARAATSAGLGPAYNVSDGFEGDLGSDGHRGRAGWRAEGLPWRQS
ncbi:MAG: reverse transcriptase-like protein [Actinomycetes bacterium]